MPWTPWSTAGLTKPLIQQMLAIMARDIGSALAYFYPTQVALTGPGQYDVFREYDLDLVPVQGFPALLLTPESDDVDEESQHDLSQDVRLYCSIACTHQDGNALAERLEDYVRAVRSVWESAWKLTQADFYSTSIPLPQPLYPAGSLAPGLQQNSLKEFFISGHAFSDLRGPAKAIFAKSATMVVRAHLEEA